MKCYAQHGASQGEKTIEGIRSGCIDGVIYSPRDIKAAKLAEHIDSVASASRNADQFFDPQYYAAFNVGHDEARRGHLPTEYTEYFRLRRRRDLESGLDNVREDIRDCLGFQAHLPLTGLISPNVLISRSLDSVEAVISKNFIRTAGEVHAEREVRKPLYITLALSREALMDERELIEFLTDITLLDRPPAGFYLLVASRNEDARSDIYNADVIGSWMLINYTLALNGYSVINGYSDILTPFLGVAGAAAGATGWWSNLRTFSLGRFLPAVGGRLPVQRYLSKLLLNRVAYFELHQLRELHPQVLNCLETDALYPPDAGSEPERVTEVLQSWEAIKSLCSDLCLEGMTDSLAGCRDAITRARKAYDEIASLIRLDSKSNADHLPALEEGLKVFMRLAEIPSPTANEI
jgi:hypothetical protein